MNRKIGMVASAVNVGAVVCFALCMPISFNSGSYFYSMFIAFSFMVMMCAFAFFADQNRKVAGIAAVGLSSVYAAIILLVYFAQLTTVRLEVLSEQAASLLDFQKMGLVFNYDLLGYAVMGLATFFAGLTVEANSKELKWLKGLLLGHGVFFISCLIVPMLGLFSADGDPRIGVLLLEFWCAYFVPIGVLSWRYFSKA